MYFVIVKHGSGAGSTYSLCPITETSSLVTEFETQAKYKAVENKACNPSCDYYVVKVVGSAQLNTAPKYHFVPTETKIVR